MFPPILIGAETGPGMRVRGAAWKYSNPSMEAYKELPRAFSERDRVKVACFVSIGAGPTQIRPLPGPSLRTIAQSLGAMAKGERPGGIQVLVNMATDCEPVHVTLRKEPSLKDAYFRFNPENITSYMTDSSWGDKNIDDINKATNE